MKKKLLFGCFMFISLAMGAQTVSSITATGSDISAINGTSQITATINPSNAAVQGVVWSVSDPAIATINAAGLLTARKNGTVTVTATTQEAGSSVFGTTAPISVSNQPVPVREFYLDYGPNDGTNGDLTPVNSADVFGHYWNNVTTNMPTGITPVPVTLASNLVDKSNSQSTISVTVNSSSVFTNGKLNGALLVPNTNYLGELGIGTATEDYFSTGSNGTLTFAGLDINKGYRFRIFGARDNTVTRTSRYKFTGSNTVTGTLQTSGTNLGGTGVNNNNSGIYVSDLVYPNSSGAITLYIDIAVGTFAYMNVMKIEEFTLGQTTDVSNIQRGITVNRNGNNEFVVNGAHTLLELYAADGRKVLVQNPMVDNTINTAKFSKGIYILTIDKAKTIKIIF
jgi:hypothetical protein